MESDSSKYSTITAIIGLILEQPWGRRETIDRWKS